MVYGYKQASKQAFRKCSHASVSLAQARPNYKYMLILTSVRLVHLNINRSLAMALCILEYR